VDDVVMAEVITADDVSLVDDDCETGGCVCVVEEIIDVVVGVSVVTVDVIVDDVDVCVGCVLL
jgi:hypothetical protein